MLLPWEKMPNSKIISWKILENDNSKEVKGWLKQTLIIRAVPNRTDTQTPESEGARCLPCIVAFLETESLKNNKIAKLRLQNVAKLRIPACLPHILYVDEDRMVMVMEDLRF